MAIYDYRCKSCNAFRTISRGIAEKEEIPNCNTCNIALTRVYSNIGVTFNGSGFYTTDKR
jgi:putative FmdB family regulatory protein